MSLGDAAASVVFALILVGMVAGYVFYEWRLSAPYRTQRRLLDDGTVHRGPTGDPVAISFPRRLTDDETAQFREEWRQVNE